MSISARRKGNEERPIERAVAVSVERARLRVTLADGRELSVPVSWFPRLQRATEKQRANWRLIGAGSGIHWSEVDEDISVASLLGLPSD